MSKKEQEHKTDPAEQEVLESELENKEVENDREEAFREENDKLKGELEALKDKYLRIFAEFDNYKKRNIKERLDLMKTAARDTMAGLLPVLDDFDRAKKFAEDPKTDETLSEGVKAVYHKLYRVLEQQGLQPMETDGVEFDPDLHEAVTEIPAPSEALKGKVVDTIEKGYKLNEHIIRHAKVVVGK